MPAAPPRIVLATAGSLGDLHPFIALGVALKARGFTAEIATAPDHRAKIEAESLVFHPVGPSLEALQAEMGMTAAELTRAVARSNTFLFETMLLPRLEEGARAMIAAADGASAIVGSTFAAGAAMAAETLGVPFVPVALQPTVVFSAYDPPRLPPAPWLAPASGGWRLALNRATIGAARMQGTRWTAAVDRTRGNLGLPERGDNLLLDGLKGHALALGLYSPLLGPAQADAPQGFAVVGDAPYDSDLGGGSVMPPTIEAFVEAGPAPIVFTLGSAAVNIPGDFYRQSLAAARGIGRRAVLLVGPQGDLEVADGADVLAVAYAPYSLLFPRAAAVVHQGGIGTVHQALRAGRPQVIVPHLGDQFDNGARVARLGCGRVIARRRYKSKQVVATLSRMLDDAAMLEAAREIGTVTRRADGAGDAADRIAALISPARPG